MMSTSLNIVILKNFSAVYLDPDWDLFYVCITSWAAFVVIMDSFYWQWNLAGNITFDNQYISLILKMYTIIEYFKGGVF